MNDERPHTFRLVGLLMVGFAVLAWVAGFTSGLVLSPPIVAVPEDVEAPANFGLFNEAWSIINSEYYGQRPAPEAIADHAVEGLVAALGDPYAAYVDEGSPDSRSERFGAELVTDAGIWIEPVVGGALILAVLPGSPAEEAGLAPGDTVLTVGEDELAGASHQEMVKALSGPRDSTAELVVIRPEEGPHPYQLVRRPVSPPRLALDRPQPGVATLRLPPLTAEALPALDEAIAALRADPPATLLLDLRDNPGGDPHALLATAGRFMSGPVWVEVNREGDQTPRPAETAGVRSLDRPGQAIILVNRGTAGTAEMLAGALHDALGAKVIGQPTFGRGTIQALTELSDDSKLRLTVSHWRTPSGTDVDEKGLTPDLAVEMTAEDRAAGRDPQMDAALDAAAETVTDRNAAGG